MKATTAVVLCSVATLVVFSAGYSGHAEQPAADPLSRIGVVSVMKILRDCQRQSTHEKEVAAEQDKINAELSEMNQKLAKENDQLKTFKPGSPEYLDLYKSMAEGQGKLRALQEYYQNASTLKDKQWTEQLFRDVVEATAKIADQKGLALVLERTEPEYPIPAERFFLAVGSYKVLYAKGCVDLTTEVQAVIDKK